MTMPKSALKRVVMYAMPGVGSGPMSSTFTPAATKPASSADSNMYPERRVSLPMRTVPPSGASTRAAALARCSAKSTVMGCSPTRPRTPSVPKYRLAKSASALHGGHGFQGIDRRRHIVGAHDARALQYRHHGERDAAVDPLRRRAIENLAEHRLAGEADEYRPAERRQLIEPAQQLGIVRQRLAEPEPRIDR